MPPNLQLSRVVVEVVKHTPPYVWAILLALVVVGCLQLRDHAVARRRLTWGSLALAGYSLSGVGLAFGFRAEVIAAWVLGLITLIGANHLLQRPRDIGIDSAGRYALRGSAWPLLTMLTVFALRYAVTVTLVFHRDWAADAAFSGAIAFVYGTLSGFFAARALRILRTSAPATPAAALALS
jgi:hypothetical protein